MAYLFKVIIAIKRKKWKSYTSDWYNRIDWMVIIGYTFGMILRSGEGSSFRITSKCLLLIAFMLLCIRVLIFCCMTSFLGPKLVIIQKLVCIIIIINKSFRINGINNNTVFAGTRNGPIHLFFIKRKNDISCAMLDIKMKIYNGSGTFHMVELRWKCSCKTKHLSH